MMHLVTLSGIKIVKRPHSHALSLDEVLIAVEGPLLLNGATPHVDSAADGAEGAEKPESDGPALLDTTKALSASSLKSASCRCRIQLLCYLKTRYATLQRKPHKTT